MDLAQEKRSAIGLQKLMKPLEEWSFAPKKAIQCDVVLAQKGGVASNQELHAAPELAVGQHVQWEQVSGHVLHNPSGSQKLPGHLVSPSSGLQDEPRRTWRNETISLLCCCTKAKGASKDGIFVSSVVVTGLKPDSTCPDLIWLIPYLAENKGHNSANPVPYEPKTWSCEKRPYQPRIWTGFIANPGNAGRHASVVKHSAVLCDLM